MPDHDTFATSQIMNEAQHQPEVDAGSVQQASKKQQRLPARQNWAWSAAPGRYDWMDWHMCERRSKSDTKRRRSGIEPLSGRILLRDV